MFNGYINPYFYVMLIICLPQITPKWFLLFFSFFLGLFIDLFEGTVGFHSTAIVIMAFIKPTVEKIVIPKNKWRARPLPAKIRIQDVCRIFSFISPHSSHYFIFTISF